MTALIAVWLSDWQVSRLIATAAAIAGTVAVHSTRPTKENPR